MFCEKCGKYSGKYRLCYDCYSSEYDDNTCEICGEYSNGYPLCKKCYYKVKEFAEEYFIDDEIFEDNDYEIFSQGHCIACNKNKENSEYFLCADCYKKYKNKELIISLIHGREIKILESRYYNRYRCYDGHLVKSKSEREIDNFLFKKNIRHIYEKPISISSSEKDDIHPDFYLYDLDVYIEHLGKEGTSEYDEKIKFKTKIYQEKQLTVIFTHEYSDSIDMQNSLERKLKTYKRGSLNWLNN